MTDRMKAAIEAAGKELLAMNDEEFAAELEKAEDTPEFHALNYAMNPSDYYNCIRCGRQNMKDVSKNEDNCAFCGKLQIMPDYDVWRGNEI